ncbi:MAG TPA: hypothetical protein VF322_00710 [Gammaproteobacteria bacterium]
MRSIGWSAGLLVLAALAELALGQEGGEQTREEQAPAPPASSEESRASAPPPEAGTERPKPSDDVFIPTEEIAADEEIIFPVDI